MFESLQDIVEFWTIRLIAVSLFAAVLLGMIAIVFAIKRPAPVWECWVWRLACVKILLMTLFPVAIELPLLPKSLEAVVALRRANVDVVGITSDELRSEPSEAPGLFANGQVLTTGATQNADRAFNQFKKRDQFEQHEKVQTPDTRSERREAAGKSDQKTANWSYVLILIGMIWLGGVAWQLARAVAQWLQANGLVAKSKPLRNAELTQFVFSRARRRGLTRPPRLRISSNGVSPSLVGLRQPCIIFPASFVRSCSVEEAKLVVEHELAHIVRRDLFWNWLVALSQALFFFHPLPWVAWRRTQVTQEMACDHFVLSSNHSRVADYGRLLLKIMLLQQPTRSYRIAEVSASGRAGTLEERLLAMKRYSMGQRQMTRFGWVAGVGALVVMLPWQLSAFPTSESGERQVVRSIEEGQGQSTVTRSLLGTNAQDTTASTGTQSQDSQRRQRQQDETQGQRGSATSTGTTRSTQSSHATGSSSSSATSVSSGGSQRDGSSNVSRSISYSKDGNSISVKQRGDRFTVERTRRVDGKDKVEKFEFKSEDEFRRRLPEDFKRFKEMTSASLGSHGGGVEVKGGGDAVDNPAQQQLLEHLRKMREENADNPQIRQLIDQMIREILTSSTDDRAK